jgi:hypothetical protein
MKLVTVSAEIRHVSKDCGRIAAPPQREKGWVTSRCPRRNTVVQGTLSPLDRGEEISAMFQTINFAKDACSLRLVCRGAECLIII